MSLRDRSSRLVLSSGNVLGCYFAMLLPVNRLRPDYMRVPAELIAFFVKSITRHSGPEIEPIIDFVLTVLCTGQVQSITRQTQR